jgi:hypothetical protein
MLVELYQAGNPAPEEMLRSIQQWLKNGMVPLRMTRNKPSSALSGQYLLLLMMFKLIWLQANYCECIAFIANTSNDVRVFLEQDVGIALRKLGYMMKVTSTVAYQVFTQRNLDCHQLYWTWPWPFGIHRIPRCQLIDADEFELHLNAANRK